MEQSESFAFYGTSPFSAAILDGLIKAGYAPQLVVTTLAKPAGRDLLTEPTAVAKKARALKLNVIEVSSLRATDIQSQIASYNCSYAILAAFGKIVPESILKSYAKGIINVHPSLLPKYRGPSPIQSAMLNGDIETGVTLIILDNEVDHGPILAQRTISIDITDTADSLSNKLEVLSIELLLATLPKYLSGEISPIPQVHKLANFTKIISRDDGLADFSASATNLELKLKAYQPWPGLWTKWDGRRLKFLRVRVIKSESNQPGVTRLSNEGNLLIDCSTNTLEILNVQIDGGKPMSCADFINGHRAIVGYKF